MLLYLPLHLTFNLLFLGQARGPAPTALIDHHVAKLLAMTNCKPVTCPLRMIDRHVALTPRDDKL